MARAYGNNAHIGVAIETTYATPVTTATDFLEIKSESWGLTEELSFSSTLNTRTARAPVEGKSSTAGEFEIEGCYTGMEEFIKAVMGSGSTSGPNVDGQYTHTFALAEALPVGYTLQVNKDSSGGGTGIIYPGVQFNKMSISQAIGEYAKVTFGGMGNGVETTGSTMTSPSFAAFKGMKWSGISVLTLNNVTVPCRNIEFSIENALAEDVYKLGSKTRQELKANGARKVAGKVECYFDGLTQYTLATAGTEFAAVFTWQGPLIAGSSYYEFSISLPKCRATIETPKIGGPGPILLTLPYQAIQNAAANDECVITLKNVKAAI